MMFSERIQFEMQTQALARLLAHFCPAKRASA